MVFIICPEAVQYTPVLDREGVLTGRKDVLRAVPATQTQHQLDLSEGKVAYSLSEQVVQQHEVNLLRPLLRSKR